MGCEASETSMGILFEVDGKVVEDASWLRKGDYVHIHVAELGAPVKLFILSFRLCVNYIFWC